MKYLDLQATVPCAICGHPKDLHMMVCGDRDCDCLCFIPTDTEQRMTKVRWQETAIFAVLDLLIQEREGEVAVESETGSEWKIKVSCEHGTKYTTLGVGKS